MNRQDEQYFRTAADRAASKELALTAFGIYAGLKMARDPEGSISQIADEIRQAHDDLDTLDVPRQDNGMTLSLPGRILLSARIQRIELERLRQDKRAAVAFWKTTARRFAQARRVAISQDERGTA